MPETMRCSEAPRRLLGSTERQHRRDAEAGEVRFAALEESSPEAGLAGLRRDTDLQEPRALGALVLDRRCRPADELAVVFGGPIAAVRVRRLRGGRMSQSPLRPDAVRPDAVQQLGRRPEVLARTLPHHDLEHTRLPKRAVRLRPLRRRPRGGRAILQASRTGRACRRPGRRTLRGPGVRRRRGFGWVPRVRR